MRILHVEDDLDLSEVVELAFRSFGFRGAFDRAPTVARAYAILDSLHELDLVISDMRLPDGTGLEVVRRVRDHPVWCRTPVLVLSGEPPSEAAAKAYALGANAYVSKSVRGRTTHDLVRALYDHWLRDVVLPPSGEVFERFLATSARIRQRYAAFDLQMAGRFPEDSDFWIGRALTVSNQASLIRFFGDQLLLRSHRPSASLLEEILALQRDNERVLTEVEVEVVRRPVSTREDACRHLARLFEPAMCRYDVVVRLLTELSPFPPSGTAGLISAFADDLEKCAAWIEAHLSTPEIREQVARMRMGTTTYRALWSTT